MKTFQKLWLAIFLTIVFIPGAVIAQETGKIETGERQIEQERQLRERIEEKKPAAPIEEETPEQQPPVSGEQKAFIRKINVTRATLVPMSEINAIVAPYENKELTLSGMQQVVDRITDAYRRRGYVTSRAYLPPQKIEQGTLEIICVEAVTGDIEVRGARYFRVPALRSAINPKTGEPFNYAELKKSLAALNSHPDRKVKASLVPGKQPGSTDIILEVKDRLPVHLRLDYDNFASRYVGKDRYTAVLSHNNLLGLDDIFSLQYQITDRNAYELTGARYVLPVGDRVKLGLSASHSHLELGKEFEALQARGKSRLYNAFALYELINDADLRVTLNAGFDYLDTYNFQLGAVQSRDRARVAKLGFDIDYSDMIGGRTIFSPQAEFGIPDIMGGMDSKDSLASRSGAGGKFVKETFALLRLQKMPFSSTLLWKNYAQVSPYVLAASEQFQVGGISNVRGYPSGELVGDQGFATSLEWAFPVYGMPQSVKVPFSSATLYEALRVAAFYDYGYVSLHRPQTGEAKNKSLDSAGFGVRFNLPEDLSVRADFAWAMARTPSDGHHFHPWISVSKEF